MHLNCAAGDRSGELTFCELFPGCLSTFDVETAGKLVSQGRVFWLAKYTVQVVTLADVCRTFLPGRQVDLLSVDTEGFDLQVLAGLDLNVNRPSLIISETDVAGEEKGDAIQEFLRQHSYHRIQVLGYNAFYAPNS
jgi:FkbM family methyltransferase